MLLFYQSIGKPTKSGWSLADSELRHWKQPQWNLEGGIQFNQANSYEARHMLGSEQGTKDTHMKKIWLLHGRLYTPNEVTDTAEHHTDLTARLAIIIQVQS